jgi:hypothetical protein
VAGSIGTSRYAGQAAIALGEVSKFVRFEAFVPDKDHGVGQKRQKIFGCCYLSALTGEEEESHDMAAFINGRGEL